MVINKADKGFYVVVWDRNDYITEVEKQLSEKDVYKQVSFKEKALCDLVEICNRSFSSIKLNSHISEKKMKYFMYAYKKVTNLGELYLLPKIHKRLYDVPGIPVISNYSTPNEKFLSHYVHLQEGWSYVKDTADFLKKLQNMEKNFQNFILVTADVVGLDTSLPHNPGLEILKNALDCRQNKIIPTNMLVKMAKFFFTNNYFEFG